jgi:DNA-binding MurR/RpiR family transcriptional regulator
MSNNGNGLTSDNYKIDENTSIEGAIEKTFALSHKILTECESFAVAEEIKKAASVILKSGKVLIVGSGTSGLSAKYAYLKLFRLGINCKAETDPVIFSMEASLLKKNDVFIGVSSSGRTSSVVNAAKTAAEKKAVIISLSDYAVSPLNKIADINLYTTPRNTNLFKNLEMPLLIGQISLIDLLFSLLCLDSPSLVDSVYLETKKITDQLKL